MNGISVPWNNRSASDSQLSRGEAAGECAMTASDAFAKFAENQISAPRKRAMCAAEKRLAKRAERAQAEKAELQGIWSHWHQQRKTALLEGAHKDAARQLISLLEHLTPEQGNELIACARAFQSADTDTRATVLSLCNVGITRMRESHGWPPFDDPIPFPEDDRNVFLVLRGVLS
jgi:hypothetical protein